MKDFAVIGLGRFGASVARTLASMGYNVLGVDSHEELVQAIAPSITHAVQADATDEETLKALGIRNFDVVVVAIGNDLEASILVTLTLKELGVNQVIAKASTELHGKVLTRIGADRVVFPERDMGMRLAQSLVSTNILDYIELSPDYSIVELTAGRAAGKTLRDLDLRARYGVNVMALRRGQKIIVAPLADDEIAQDTVLVVIGHNDNLRRLERELGE